MSILLWLMWLLGTFLFVLGIVMDKPLVTAAGIGFWIAMPVTIWTTGF